MIQFYYHATPNPAKVAFYLEETGLPYKLIPIDTAKGEQHTPAYRAINPNGKTPAIIDNGVRVFDSSAILMYLSEKTGELAGAPEYRAELLSWLMFIGTGLGPFSGQAVHFQRAAPEKIPYAINRYLREAQRHYEVLDNHMADRTYIVGEEFTIADVSAWGWIDKANVVLGESGLDPYKNLKQWFEKIDSKPAAKRAREIGKDIEFKAPVGEEARKALYPSNYPVDL